MVIDRGYKVEIAPNLGQERMLERACGTARFVYNWGLSQRINLYQQGSKKSLSFIDQNNSLNSIKKEQYPWMLEVSKFVPSNALRNLDKSFSNFFRGIKQGKKVGFPKFKSKHRNIPKFTFQQPIVKSNSILIPKIGYVRLKEKDYIPLTNVKYNNVTVSKIADRWFVSVNCEVEIPDISTVPTTVLGVDVGIKTLAMCSDGKPFENNKYLKKMSKRLAFAQRKFSKKKKGSNNRLKAKLKLQKIHVTIANKRKDSIHKMTSTLVRTKPRYIVIENLNVYGMLKNHCLAGAIADASFSETKRQFLYKTAWHGGEIIQAERFFPSSKNCCICGKRKDDLKLSDRIYICDCGNIIDRDENAAINLESYGLSTLGLSGIKAYGESVRLVGGSEL